MRQKSTTIFGEVGVAHLFSFLCFPIMCRYVPSCDVRNDFRIKIMFGSSLPPDVCRRAHVLFTSFVYSGVQHILCCVFVLFVFAFSTLCKMLPVALD